MIVAVFILMVMGGLENYDPKSDNIIPIMSNNSDSTTKDELQKNKKIEFEQKYPKIKWRVIRYATNYFDCKEIDFHSEYKARDLERYLISDMIDIKNYFKRARLEVKIVHIYYK